MSFVRLFSIDCFELSKTTELIFKISFLINKYEKEMISIVTDAEVL